MTRERRSAPRLNLRFNVSYTISWTKKQGTGVTTNLSGAGIRFIAEHILPVGQQLDLRIVLPDLSQPVPCVGQVAWSRPSNPSSEEASEVGVRFITISDAHRKILSQYAMLYPDDAQS